MLPRPLTLRFIAVVALTALVSGCYLPARFNADVEVQRTGYYSLDFIGYIASIPMYTKLKKGELTREQERGKIQQVVTDFKRDTNTKSVEYYREGHFKVNYSKTGDLLKTGLVTFIRRNDNMLSLEYSRKTKLITMRGKYIMKKDADRLRDMGLWVEGEVTLKTDATILSHNATRIIKGKYRQKTLFWEIKSPYDPAPKAVLSLQ